MILSKSKQDAAEIENPDSLEGDAITRQIVHDTMTLAGMDADAGTTEGNLRRFWRCN